MVATKSLCVLSALLLAGALVSCGGGSDDDPSMPPGTATLRVLMTDAPTDELSQINVYIVGFTVKRTGEPVERIANDVGLVDLLTLRNVLRLLATAGVDGGTYEFIRVDLDQDRSYVVEVGSTAHLPLKIPSEEIKVNGGFTVPVGMITSLTLDFDAAASIKQLGNGDWLLTPIIILANVETS